jgi:SAM-dependent methyltransferase
MRSMSDAVPSSTGKLAAGWRRLRHALRPEWLLARSRWWQSHPDLLQPWPFTTADRHPDFFDLVAGRLADRADARILSFGCATGEEVFALAERLPHAQIDGIDINAACIAKARARTGRADRERLRFSVGGTVPDVAAHYDAILCLSVLRHARLDSERPDSCAAILPFATYAGFVAQFDRALNPGGLLILWAANFLFTDTATSRDYTHVPVGNRRGHSPIIYGPDNLRRDIDTHHLWAFEKAAA